MSDTSEVQQKEDDWTTWSDAELMSRLLRRGTEPVAAKALVRDRQMPDAVEEIQEVLDFKLLDDDDKEIRLETSLERRARR